MSLLFEFKCHYLIYTVFIARKWGIYSNQYDSLFLLFLALTLQTSTSFGIRHYSPPRVCVGSQSSSPSSDHHQTVQVFLSLLSSSSTRPVVRVAHSNFVSNYPFFSECYLSIQFFSSNSVHYISSFYKIIRLNCRS